MKRTREITNEEIYNHNHKQSRTSELDHLDIIEDVWLVILIHTVDTPWPLQQGECTNKPLVCSLGLVCKQWQRLLTRAITTVFMELKRHSIEVDFECRMLYPYMLWKLKQEMYAFCCKLKMKPADILMTVAPQWGNVPITDEELKEINLNGLPIVCAWSKKRLNRHQLGRVLIEYQPITHKLVMGPWSFGGTWDAFLLALFLLCRPSRYGCTGLEKLAVARYIGICNNLFGNFNPLVGYEDQRELCRYYRFDFPAYTASLMSENGLHFVCTHKKIEAIAFYGLFPSVIDWLSFHGKLDIISPDMIRTLNEKAPADAAPLDIAVNWKCLFRDPMTFLLTGYLHKAYRELKDNPLFRSIWKASEGLREAYRKALYYDGSVQAMMRGGEIQHPI